MADTPGTLELVARHLTLALRPLVDGVSDLPHFKQLMYRLGWSVADLPPEYQTLSAAVKAAVAKLDTLGDSPSADDIAELLRDAKQVYDAIQGIAAAPPGVDAAAFLSEVRERLPELLLTDYLALELPALYRVLLMLNVIRVEHQAATANRPSFVRVRPDWSQIPFVLGHPQELPAIVYGWGTRDLNVQRIVDHLAELLFAFGLPVNIEAPDSALAATYAGLDDDAGLNAATSLVVPFWFGKVAGQPVQLAVAVRELPGTATALPGLVVEPQIPAQLPLAFPLSGTLALRLTAGTNAGSQVGILIRPHDVSIKYPFAPGTPPPQAGIGVGLDFKPAATTMLLGSAGATRLELKSASLDLAAQSTNGELDVVLGAETDGLVFVLAAKDLDGFLSEVIGGRDATVAIPLRIQWSHRSGLSFAGGPGFTVTQPVALQLGPVTVDALSLALRTTTEAGHAPDLIIEAGASLGTAIGPFAVSVSNTGIQLTVTFQDGNAGPFDVAVGYKAPTGVGLAVDAGIIAGGGFIRRDPASGRYSGVLDLRAGQVDITALGLLDTKLPAGYSGYALLLALRATFPAIQIGFGFALTGVGGLLALNRRVDVDALRSRLAAGTAGRILAPQDPIRNAPALLADLDAVFPVAPGITVVGPTVQLLWAGLVHLDVGVFIELPGPARVVLLGSAHAEIERDGRAYLSIRVDIVGVVDLRAETAAFDAVLIDSHLMGMLDLTGGAAFRLSWGAQPYAVLSLGGFNPAYDPEPLSFPATLTRIAMVHGTPSDELYLRFEGYFAITSNTLQFGASVEVIIQSDHFIEHGSVGFDALIQRSPFHFRFDIRASVTVAYRGQTLAGLTLTGSLTGPGPVVVQAKVCIELLFFDICFSGTFPLGPAIAPLSAAAADLLDTLLGELGNPATLRAAGAPDPYVRLQPPDPSLTTAVVAPSGTLVWEQQSAPLDLLLTRVGGAPLPAAAQVSATSPASSTAQSDWFAPGQFVDLTDDQALTRPAYERLTGGLRLAGAGVADGPGAQALLTTTQIRLPADAATPGKPVIMFPAWILTSAPGPATPAIAVRTESWIVTTPAGERSDLTGAQARQLATLTTSARAIPATDRLAAFTF